VTEKTDEWNYVLNDGTGVPRQLTDMDGEVTMFVRYSPWGKPIETDGIGNFDASFIGTLIDATTGLIYIGNGQYYDPETGRFLTRGVNPNSTNPYVPWIPIGTILTPLGLLILYYSRKRSLQTTWIVLAFFALIVSACCPIAQPTPKPTTAPDTTASTQEPAGPGSVTAQTPSPTETPNETPASTATTSQCGGYCAAWTGGAGFYNRSLAVEFANKNKVEYEKWRNIVPHPKNDCTNFVSYALREGGLIPAGKWQPGEPAWVNTPELFNFLKDNAGFTENTEVFINTQDGRTLFNKDYLQLRENNKKTAEDPIHGNQVLNHWDSFIAKNQNIQRGDLVFLLDPTEYDGAWSHVEIVTGWGDETTWDSQITNSIMEPLVVDHSGRIQDPAKLPRSVGDTAGVGIQRVVFLRGP